MDEKRGEDKDLADTAYPLAFAAFMSPLGLDGCALPSTCPVIPAPANDLTCPTCP
jgi:hypothetical protein